MGGSDGRTARSRRLLSSTDISESIPASTRLRAGRISAGEGAPSTAATSTRTAWSSAARRSRASSEPKSIRTNAGASDGRRGSRWATGRTVSWPSGCTRSQRRGTPATKSSPAPVSSDWRPGRPRRSDRATCAPPKGASTSSMCQRSVGIGETSRKVRRPRARRDAMWARSVRCPGHCGPSRPRRAPCHQAASPVTVE